ncbi:MAG: hypothetical protein GIW99_08280 [Candidatus Eremiobacteraeota bacterium]|nr:hypothetical protein [Candidatus Eremiobacteraeota bacterium]MBC5827660.1 hypothetical protein [Candidatus Eremiobacteraeota bacterium]
MERRPGVLVGRTATVARSDQEPPYYTALHRTFVGRTGCVHAVVPSGTRDNPLIKMGFDGGTRIIFYHLSELKIDSEAPLVSPPKHGRRGSHLP